MPFYFSFSFLSITMSEEAIHLSVPQRIIIKFLAREDIKATEILPGLGIQFEDKILRKS